MQLKFAIFVAIFAYLAFLSSYAQANPVHKSMSSWSSFDVFADTLLNIVWSEDLDRTARALGVLNGDNILKVINIK